MVITKVEEIIANNECITRPYQDKTMNIQFHVGSHKVNEQEHTPVPLQHGSSNRHTTRDLEGHATQKIHALPSIWMKGRVNQMLCMPKFINRQS